MAEEIINGIEVEKLSTMVEQLQADPSLGRSAFRVRNRWVEGGYNESSVQEFFAAGREDHSRAEPFIVAADEPPVLAGSHRGPNPVELLLAALESPEEQ